MDSRDLIKKYYLLCSAQIGERKHIINDISNENRDLLFSKKEISVFLRKKDGLYVAREVIIGGREVNNTPCVVIY